MATLNLNSILNNQSTALVNNNQPGLLTPAATSTPVSTAVIAQEIQKLTQSTLLMYPSEVPKYYMRMTVSDYSRTSLLKLGQLNNIGTVILPLPTPLVDAHNVDYEEKDLGAFIGVLGSGFTGGRPNTPQGSVNNSRAALQDIGINPGVVDRNIQASTVQTLGAGRSLPLIGPLASIALDPARAAWGLSPNHFLTILLKGPKYKMFEFQWKLSPKSPEESETIRKIKKNLNNWMSPGIVLSGAVFSFPKIFDLAIMPNSKYMYKFKPAVLASFTINYSPAGQPAFYKGSTATDNLNAPEGFDMSMRFLELEYWLDQDYNDSNEPTDQSYTGPQSSNPDPNIPLPNVPPLPFPAPGPEPGPTGGPPTLGGN